MSIMTAEGFAETYTLPELKAKRKDVADKLTAMDMITSASSGAGASYSRTERIKANELFNLITAAIRIKENRDTGLGGSVKIVRQIGGDF